VWRLYLFPIFLPIEAILSINWGGGLCPHLPLLFEKIQLTDGDSRAIIQAVYYLYHLNKLELWGHHPLLFEKILLFLFFDLFKGVIP
jgi:hypothetical protein